MRCHWYGPLDHSKTGQTEDRYVKAIEVKEVQLNKADTQRVAERSAGDLNLFTPLYRNNRNGTLTDIGVISGAAGVDAADLDGSGRQGLVIGKFSNEMMALYANDGAGLFIDHAPATVIGRASPLTLTFGCFFSRSRRLPDILRRTATCPTTSGIRSR